MRELRLGNKVTVTMIEGDYMTPFNQLNQVYLIALSKAVNFQTYNEFGSREILIDYRSKNPYNRNDDKLKEVIKIINACKNNSQCVNVIIYLDRLNNILAIPSLYSILELCDIAIKYNPIDSLFEILKMRNSLMAIDKTIYDNIVQEGLYGNLENKKDKDGVNMVKVDNLGIMLLVKGLENIDENKTVYTLAKYTQNLASFLSDKMDLGEELPIGICTDDYSIINVQEAVESIESSTDNTIITMMVDESFIYTDKLFNIITKDIDIVYLLDLNSGRLLFRTNKLNSVAHTFAREVNFELITKNTHTENEIDLIYNLHHVDDNDEELDADIYDRNSYKVVVLIDELESSIYLDSELYRTVPTIELLDTMNNLTDIESTDCIIEEEFSTFNIICKDKLMSQKVYDIREELLERFM